MSDVLERRIAAAQAEQDTDRMMDAEPIVAAADAVLRETATEICRFESYPGGVCGLAPSAHATHPDVDYGMWGGGLEEHDYDPGLLVDPADLAGEGR